MADAKLSALALGTLAEATEIYLNASGSKKTTFTTARDFLLSAACRANCVAATTAAQTLASDFEVSDVIDGVTLALTDRVLIKNQSAGSENGIYTVNASGAPTRATDFDTDVEAVLGALVAVSGGTINGTSVWMHSTTGVITLGSTSLTFSELLAASTFLQLSDTPADFTDDSRKLARVNDAETAVEFVAEHHKEPVKFATTAALTLATDFENGDPLDGGTLTTGDRILIKDQAVGNENGIYIVEVSGVPTRAPDMDDDPDVIQGMTVVCLQGSINANTFFQLTTTGSITLGSTALTFVNAGSAADTILDIGVSLEGQPSSSQLLVKYVFVRSASFAINLTGSRGHVNTAALAQTDFDIQKNAISIGTVRFAASATTATFIFSSGQTFVAGDRLSIIAPASVDANLADVSVTLKGSRP